MHVNYSTYSWNLESVKKDRIGAQNHRHLQPFSLVFAVSVLFIKPQVGCSALTPHSLSRPRCSFLLLNVSDLASMRFM